LGLSSVAGFHPDAFLLLMAVVFAVLAALLTARGQTIGHESHEALTGWVFLCAASVAILLVAHRMLFVFAIKMPIRKEVGQKSGGPL
jgi:hypothetical protein